MENLVWAAQQVRLGASSRWIRVAALALGAFVFALLHEYGYSPEMLLLL
jgi:hypothetical protein